MVIAHFNFCPSFLLPFLLIANPPIFPFILLIFILQMFWLFWLLCDCLVLVLVFEDPLINFIIFTPRCLLHSPPPPPVTSPAHPSMVCKVSLLVPCPLPAAPSTQPLVLSVLEAWEGISHMFMLMFCSLYIIKGLFVYTKPFHTAWAHCGHSPVYLITHCVTYIFIEIFWH